MKNDLSDPRDVALRPFEMIAPLLEPDLEPAEKALRREAILASQEAKGTPISARTLRRYLQNYCNFRLAICSIPVDRSVFFPNGRSLPLVFVRQKAVTV